MILTRNLQGTERLNATKRTYECVNTDGEPAKYSRNMFSVRKSDIECETLAFHIFDSVNWNVIFKLGSSQWTTSQTVDGHRGTI